MDLKGIYTADANDTIEGKELTFKKTAEGSGVWDKGTYEIIGNKKLKKKK